MESTIKYVLKKYQEGRLDPGKAVSEFRRRHHSSPAGRAAVWSLSLAASLLLGLFLFNNWRNAWTEYGTPDGKSMAVLAELASKMISLGCKDAMNFDGGGSSCIVGKDGAILNNPSDGSERVVTSAIVITELPH